VIGSLDKKAPLIIGAAMPLAIGAPIPPVMAPSFLGGAFFFIALPGGEVIEAFFGGMVAKETCCFDSSVSDSISLL
jgi:hypothetical protein